MFVRSLKSVNRVSNPFSQRSFATLVLSEHFEGNLNPSLGSVLNAASQLGDKEIDVLVHGEDCDK